MTIKIEFPAGDTKAAQALGRALLDYSDVEQNGQANTAWTVEINDETPSGQTDELSGQSQDLNDFTGEPAGDGVTDDTAAIQRQVDTEPAAVDHNGVPFNPKFCGQSAEPFYASGQRAGQWKKKRGVDQADYDDWYASQLPANDDTPAPAPETQVDTAGAFGGEPAAPAQTQAPRTCGEFMAWVSEQQVAGHLNSDDITNAYAAEGLQITDLFPPNDEQTVADRISKLYARLQGNV